jgi:hypothetical protein
MKWTRVATQERYGGPQIVKRSRPEPQGVPR